MLPAPLAAISLQLVREMPGLLLVPVAVPVTLMLPVVLSSLPLKKVATGGGSCCQYL
jgi:hypothetical protein